MRSASAAGAHEQSGLGPDAGSFLPEERVLPQPEAPVPIVVSNATAAALDRGHPWILTDSETSDVGGYVPGTLAHARTARGRDVGVCRIEGSGRIAARAWGGDPDGIRARIRAALRRRSRLFDAMGDDRAMLAVSKVANFAVDLPDAAVAIQISGTFGSRQEEAQRLGRILRPKPGANQAYFYTLVSRDTVEQDFALKRQLFLCEQGYQYAIHDVE